MCIFDNYSHEYKTRRILDLDNILLTGTAGNCQALGLAFMVHWVIALSKVPPGLTLALAEEVLVVWALAETLADAPLPDCLHIIPAM